MNATGRLGESLSGSEGRWLQGRAGLSTGRRIRAAAVRGELSLFGLDYLDPFSYGAGGVQLESSLSLPWGPVRVSLVPSMTAGSWSTDTLEGDLRVAGGHLAVEGRLGPLATAATAGALAVDNGATEGTFTRLGGSLTYATPRWTARAELIGQRTPEETETGGTVSLSAVVTPALTAYLSAGRTTRDPVFGTEGTGSLSAGIAVRLAAWSPPTAPAVAQVGEARADGRLVRFRLRAPEAGRVTLTGDFTNWEPVPMARSGAVWEVARVLPPGVHHFGFLVDGQWAIPPDAPGVVDDGWGRKNASIVVEP